MENSGITKADFQVFDSGFEADIHKVLNEFVCDFNEKRGCESLALYSQVKIDLSQPAFCKLGYRIDFLIAISNFSSVPKINVDWNKWAEWFEPDLSLRDEQGLFPYFIEAKGIFTSESRVKHLLLENAGFEHGKDIDIVQRSANKVARAKNAYWTISMASLRYKLEQKFPLI